MNCVFSEEVDPPAAEADSTAVCSTVTCVNMDVEAGMATYATTLGLAYDGSASISINNTNDSPTFTQVSCVDNITSTIADPMHVGITQHAGINMVNYPSVSDSLNTFGEAQTQQPSGHTVMNIMASNGQTMTSQHNMTQNGVRVLRNVASKQEEEEDPKSFNYDNVMVWLNQQSCGGAVKRKRRITRPQRVAANMRERRRMVHLNSAFENLKETIPIFPHEKKLSRIQTLKLAIDYIGFMTELLHGDPRNYTFISMNPQTPGHDSSLQSSGSPDSLECWQG